MGYGTPDSINGVIQNTMPNVYWKSILLRNMHNGTLGDKP